MKPAHEALQLSPLFCFVSDDDRRTAAAKAVARHSDRGEKIVLPGEAWPRFLLVGQGQVKAVKES